MMKQSIRKTTQKNVWKLQFSYHRLLKVMGFFLISIVVSSCNEGMNDLNDYFATQRANTAKPIKPIPELKPYLRYVYPKHEKDPFDIAMLIPDAAPTVIANGIKLDTNRVREFLEGFPLDGLNMVGTVSKENTLWALIKTPDGGVQSIKQDNYLGQNYGRVLSISETEIAIKEVVSNGSGGYKERDTQLTLKEY
jgi:type IV pilus assembly protein PilP